MEGFWRGRAESACDFQINVWQREQPVLWQECAHEFCVTWWKNKKCVCQDAGCESVTLWSSEAQETVWVCGCVSGSTRLGVLKRRLDWKSVCQNAPAVKSIISNDNWWEYGLIFDACIIAFEEINGESFLSGSFWHFCCGALHFSTNWWALCYSHIYARTWLHNISTI